jgi:hypothetical protein
MWPCGVISLANKISTVKTITNLLLITLLNSACANGQQAKKDDDHTVSMSTGGNTYQLTAVGDRVPTFLINGSAIAKEAFEDYEPLFSELQLQLEEKKRRLAQKARVLTEQSRVNLVNELVQDKLIQSTSDLRSFRLDNNGFLINGQKQSFDVFSRYKTKHLTGSHSIIQFN